MRRERRVSLISFLMSFVRSLVRSFFLLLCVSVVIVFRCSTLLFFSPSKKKKKSNHIISICCVCRSVLVIRRMIYFLKITLCKYNIKLMKLPFRKYMGPGNFEIADRPIICFSFSCSTLVCPRFI
jgi:hypothetical protein